MLMKPSAFCYHNFGLSIFLRNPPNPTLKDVLQHLFWRNVSVVVWFSISDQQSELCNPVVPLLFLSNNRFPLA
jgi:hypothetical protein